MAIKMRNNNRHDAMCCSCGNSQNESLNMFDVCIGEDVFTICDVCNEVLLQKTLKAECLKNGRTKSQHDIAIMQKRNRRK